MTVDHKKIVLEYTDIPQSLSVRFREQKITFFTLKLYLKQLIKFVNIILCHIKND